MLKSLVSVCSIFVLLFPTVFLPSRAQACPVKLPETLLSLYRSSDSIYIATFAKEEELSITEDNEDYTAIQIKKHFDISSTLKGEPRKMFLLDDTEYRYKSRVEESETPADEGQVAEESAGEEAEEVVEEEDPDASPALKAGDQLLLFLRTDEETGKPVLTDYRDGVKKMTKDTLPSYEARIRDLNSIFSAEQVSNQAIVEWLVRCAQDPVTRWEGAFEFEQSFEEMEWRDQRKADAEAEAKAQHDAEGEIAEATSEGDQAEDAEPEDDDRSVYARLLTDSQKETLMNIVLEPRQSVDSEKPAELSSGDRVLINVVSKWGDNRFARALLARIQAAADEGYLISDLMSMIAKVTSDKQLERLASRYSNVFYQEDDAVAEDVENEDEESSETSEDVEIRTDDPNSNAGDKPAPETAVPPPDEDAKPRKLTYKELRAELLARFIDRGSVVLAADTQNEERASQ